MFGDELHLQAGRPLLVGNFLRRQSDQRWLVNFGTGGVDFLDGTANYYVRAVRGG